MEMLALLLTTLVMCGWIELTEAQGSQCPGAYIDLDYANAENFNIVIAKPEKYPINTEMALRGAPPPNQIDFEDRSNELIITAKTGKFSIESMEFQFLSVTGTKANALFIADGKVVKRVSRVLKRVRWRRVSTKAGKGRVIDKLIITFNFNSSATSLRDIFLRTCLQVAPSPTPPPVRKVLKDCSDFYLEAGGNITSGIYQLPTIDPNRNLSVYCEMDKVQGPWIVIQRRQDSATSFNRKWVDYKNGFGPLDGNFWLGNDNLADLTSGPVKYSVRFTLTAFNGKTRYAEYANFEVAPESENYRVKFGQYVGDAGDFEDGFGRNNLMPFSTIDRDNDMNSTVNCASNIGGGGWWYSDCTYVSMNGKYYKKKRERADGIFWIAWKYKQTLKSVMMMITPMLAF